mmetsp:Transcript_19811/g.36892  ORF Transcript_19811/g.36892 Transcript_19811/m.36892 type:complete len:80 (-) Transcript_19811:45-284(-)
MAPHSRRSSKIVGSLFSSICKATEQFAVSPTSVSNEKRGVITGKPAYGDALFQLLRTSSSLLRSGNDVLRRENKYQHLP